LRSLRRQGQQLEEAVAAPVMPGIEHDVQDFAVVREERTAPTRLILAQSHQYGQILWNLAN
jgi:hypothetical protein